MQQGRVECYFLKTLIHKEQQEVILFACIYIQQLQAFRWRRHEVLIIGKVLRRETARQPQSGLPQLR